MARVVRNYQHVDYTVLLNELNCRQEDKLVGTEIRVEEKIRKNKPDVVSPAKRKRDSLMSNPSMRYAYSVQKNVLHDRECDCVSEIEDENFQMLAEFPAHMKCCHRCYRRALIRAGLLPNDTKWIYNYLYAFDIFGATNRDLRRLIIENKAKLCGFGYKEVSLNVREDRWQICKEESELCLYHNNYEMTEAYERIFNRGFHLQQRGSGDKDFFNFTAIICNYSWPAHVKWLKAQALELQKQQCRLQLAGVSNFARMKRFSLLYEYYTILDCNGKSPEFLVQHLVSTKEFGRYGDGESLYHLRNYQVLRFHHRRFLRAMEALKEYSVLREHWDYAEKCVERLVEGMYE